MVCDAFIFFNEIDLLELRLNILWESVDRFIIVESRKTFTNERKDLFFENNREKFNKYLEKIKYIVIDDFPEECKTAWDREYYQRNAILQGIDGMKAEDILCISDLDEIISPYAIKRAKAILKKKPDSIIDFEILNCWYYLNYVDQKSFFTDGPRACKIGEIKRVHLECRGTYPLNEKKELLPETIRCWTDLERVSCAGWHFSYIGGYEKIITKIQAFSHQEFNNAEMLDVSHIKDMIDSGKDLFDRGITEFVSMPLNRIMPEIIRHNEKRYRKWICYMNPISKKKLCKLYLKYFLETTILREPFRMIKKSKENKGDRS